MNDPQERVKAAETRTLRRRIVVILSFVAPLFAMDAVAAHYRARATETGGDEKPAVAEAKATEQRVAIQAKTRLMARAASAARQGDFAAALWYAILSLEQGAEPSANDQLRLAYYANNTPRLEYMVQHDSAVRAVAFLPKLSEQAFMTAERDGHVRFWDLQRQRKPSLFEYSHEGAVTFISLSPDGRYAITAANGDNTACVWNVATRQQLQSQSNPNPLAHDRPVTHAGFSGDGRRVITTSSDTVVKVWDVLTGELITTLPHGKQVLWAALDSGGARAVTACIDGVARLWNLGVTSKSPVQEYQHGDRVNMVQFGPDGQQVLTASNDRTARIWSIGSGAVGEAKHILTHDASVSITRFSKKGDRVVTSSADGKVRVWKAKTGICTHGPIEEGPEVHNVRFSEDGNYIVIASGNGNARVVPLTLKGRPATLCHPMGIRDARFSSDGGSVITACDDGTARVWKLAHDQQQELEQNIREGHFDRAGKRIVARNAYGAVRMWKWESKTKSWTKSPITLEGKDSYLYTVVFGGAESQYLIGWYKDGTMDVWDSHTGHRCFGPFGHESAVFAAALSPDASKLVTATKQAVHLWDVNSNKDEPRLLRQVSGGLITQVTFSSDGALIALANRQGLVRLYDAETEQKARVPLRTGSAILDVKFGPAANPQALLARCDDKIVRIWNLNENPDASLMKLEHESAVMGTDFMPEGQLVVTGSEDGVITVWDSATGEEVIRLARWPAGIRWTALSRDGRRLLVVDAGRRPTAWVLPLPLPEPDRNGRQRRAWAESLSGVTMATLEDLQALTYQEWSPTGQAQAEGRR